MNYFIKILYPNTLLGNGIEWWWRNFEKFGSILEDEC